MDWKILIAAFTCAFTTIGHFAIGSKEFLVPMLNSNFDDVPKKVMHSVFHYVSVFLILSTVVLMVTGFGVDSEFNNKTLVKFIGINFAVFAIWQLLIAFTSNIKNGPLKLFQWIFFVIIAVFSILGTCCN